ncbi:transmembrane protein 14C isoform X1 [Symphalangus syndactylus]|uniref:transmembrane protein 14C isoform X1 n=1 Tax=Symphalangus syndactylus TaxID=9590 RepID=UPI00300404DD
MSRPTSHPLNAGRVLLLGGSSPARTVPILCPPLSRDTAHAPQSRPGLPAPPPGLRAPAAAFPATPRWHSCGFRALVDSPGLRETACFPQVQAWGSLLSGQRREKCRTLAQCSVPSLAAGLLFGSLAGLGAYQLSQDPRNVWVFLATSGTLAGIMGMRFYHSGKFMPAGLIAGASLLMVAKVGVSMFNRPH